MIEGEKKKGDDTVAEGTVPGQDPIDEDTVEADIDREPQPGEMLAAEKVLEFAAVEVRVWNCWNAWWICCAQNRDQ